jgi:hypothetical protein
LSVSGRVKSVCEILDLATLAAHFTFDNPSPLADSGPNSVVSNASNYVVIPGGIINQAISFSGSSNSYFQAQGFTSIGTPNQSFSISFWISPYVLSGTLVQTTESVTSPGYCFPFLGFSSNGSLAAQIYAGGSSMFVALGPILPLSPSWTLIVQTWSSTNGLQLYMNNILVSSVPTASTFAASGQTLNYLILGNCANSCACTSGAVSAPGPFLGDIDDWRIYSRELTVIDVCSLYATT